MNPNKTLVVIPAYNEEETIREVVEGSVQYADVCVVDDASKDSTPKILSELVQKYPGKIFTHRHEKNTHIPGGVQDGMKIAVEKGYQWVITMDAGMSHLPTELPLFLNHEPCDLLIGKRQNVQGVPLYRKLVSFFGARAMNYAIEPSLWDLWGPGIKDCTSGYRRYSQRAFVEIAKSSLESKAFDFHMEALSIVARLPQRTIQEIGITYIFSNSSFNRKVLKLAIEFASRLIFRKLGLVPKLGVAENK